MEIETKVKPCGLTVEKVSSCTFNDLEINQLFLPVNWKSLFLKISEDTAVQLSTQIPIFFGEIELASIYDMVTVSRMNEPVFRAKFYE
jgi:hypothetical protein